MNIALRLRVTLAAVMILVNLSFASADDGKIVEELRQLNANVVILGSVRQPPLASMVQRDVESRLRGANQADRRAWEKVSSRAEWEQFRNERLKMLRASIGSFPPAPANLSVSIARRTTGQGYEIENIVYQSRPGLLVTANLYRPSKLVPSMTGIILCHSHFGSKTGGVRQDMAATWARAGCVVLVPDHVGHGERKQHPFESDGPHDYHLRYDTGMQLQLVGESLAGWMVWDLMRGLDILLAQRNVDANRIVVISDPAGGGDIAALAAALDTRITGAMIQNFGGPEPETGYPLPKGVEESFDYSGSGSWEPTRNLYRSAKDGFLPWSIVASIAPRRLIYDHEFYWDREEDPVWKRLQKIYGFYNLATCLEGIAGHGFVVGSAPENSHWLPINRELLYPVLERWFAISNPRKEFSDRKSMEELLCLPHVKDVKMRLEPLHVLASKLGDERGEAARTARAGLNPAELRQRLCEDWAASLGTVDPLTPPFVKGTQREHQHIGNVTVERIPLGTEQGIVVPTLLLRPVPKMGAMLPVVIGVAQQGKQEFLRGRATEISELLAAGIAVCLPDVRGLGETSLGEGRDRKSAATTLSSTELMLGESLLGGRLRDLRSVIRYLQTRTDLDGKRIALWGESLGKVNSSAVNYQIPTLANERPALPHFPEPMGGLLAVLGALFEEDVRAVYVHRGLSDFRSALSGPFCYLPHDVIVPHAISKGDLVDIVAALAPRGVRLDQMVDGQNSELSQSELERRYANAKAAYSRASAGANLQMEIDLTKKPSLTKWFVSQLFDATRSRL